MLDVCAGTNAVGIALLAREPSLDVHAMDRSAEMQAVGQERAHARGFHIVITSYSIHYTKLYEWCDWEYCSYFTCIFYMIFQFQYGAIGRGFKNQLLRPL